MTTHHFTTPRVVYLGLAYGEKDAREPRAAGRTTAPAPPARASALSSRAASR